MLNKTSILLITSLILFSCSNNIKCVIKEDRRKVKAEIINTIDSVLSSSDYKSCNKYKVTNYKCQNDSVLEVKVKTKCDYKYFVFDKNVKLLRVVNVLEEFY